MLMVEEKRQWQQEQEFDPQNLENEELLNEKKIYLKFKGRIYRSCVRLAMLPGSETWCLPENEMTILKKLKKQWK